MEEKRDITQELRVAANVQQRLIPREIPTLPGYDLAALYRPCKIISGDYFDFIRLDDRRHAMLVADVSGKGLSAGFVMAQIRTFMHTNIASLGIPFNAMTSLNDYLRQNIPPGMFVTVFYFVIDLPRAQLAAINCGHIPMLVYRAARRTVETVGEPGVAVGLAPKEVLESKIREVRVSLAPGDTILVYTDGVNEAMNAARDEFGNDRVQAIFARTGELPCNGQVEALLSELYAFTGDVPLNDDVTILALKRTEPLAPVQVPRTDRMVTVAEAARSSALPEEEIRKAVAAGKIRSVRVENLGDFVVAESDVFQLAASKGTAAPRKLRVLYCYGGSPFGETIGLELKREKKVESMQVPMARDAARQAAAYQPSLVLADLVDSSPKVLGYLAEIKKACPTAEFAVFTENPARLEKVPETASLLRQLNVRQVFDVARGSRPILLFLSSRNQG